jgi:hypothetical protein
MSQLLSHKFSKDLILRWTERHHRKAKNPKRPESKKKKKRKRQRDLKNWNAQSPIARPTQILKNHFDLNMPD